MKNTAYYECEDISELVERIPVLERQITSHWIVMREWHAVVGVELQAARNSSCDASGRLAIAAQGEAETQFG